MTEPKTRTELQDEIVALKKTNRDLDAEIEGYIAKIGDLQKEIAVKGIGSPTLGDVVHVHCYLVTSECTWKSALIVDDPIPDPSTKLARLLIRGAAEQVVDFALDQWIQGQPAPTRDDPEPA